MGLQIPHKKLRHTLILEHYRNDRDRRMENGAHCQLINLCH